MVFATATAAGWLGEGRRAEHVGFGSVLGEDGKLLRTRAGASVKPVELLREAVARAVGTGAVKYADLSSDREKDYVFAWDRMPAVEGNTSVYLQYANARARSVLGRAGREVGPGTPVVLAEAAERALALRLLGLSAPARLTSRVLALGPELLGIEAPDRL
ncbi:arginine--tRNA ligase [Saccharothrix syringae]|uniref:Arginine--tRNA ligase n=2 Tax=Saccharothrix syringae TaxID=103733 RepID=A0A5Q0H568_SACSY|nr:arginine--tRNA ligase [Saccharothrix syringae]